MVRPFYRVIVPKGDGDFVFQWQTCFKEFRTILQNKEYQFFRINIFLHSMNLEGLSSQIQIIKDAFNAYSESALLPFSVIPQSPEEPFNVVMEVGLVRNDGISVHYCNDDKWAYTAVSDDECSELWIAGALTQERESNTLALAERSFQIVKTALDLNDMNFDNVIRQWNYIGGILQCGSLDGKAAQHYQLFNEARNLVYSQYRHRPNYPAATGIGMDYNDVSVDCYALRSGDGIEIVPVRNPRQHDSYHYSQDVLVGDPVAEHRVKQPPQFERAILLNSKKFSRLIISGTASIVGQQTIGIGSVELQTKATIENIRALTSEANLMEYCPALAQYPDKYSYLRVYVKNRTDIAAVKEICTGYFGGIPVTYVQADICRDNLLVEIEGEMIS